MIRFLALIHPDRPPEEIEQMTSGVQAHLNVWLHPGIEVVSSLAWYQLQYPRCGSLESWIHETVFGVDYGDRRRYFNGFVSCESVLDRTNSGVVSAALHNNRLVLAYQDGVVRHVTGLGLADNQQFAVASEAIGG